MRTVALLSILLSTGAAAAHAGETPAAPPAAAAAAKSVPAATAAPAAAAQPAAAAYDKFKGLVGEWIDVDGTFGEKGQLAASYRLTGSGTTVVETIFFGKPHEMMTMYSRDGSDLVLTHYCAGGNQPRMRAKSVEGEIVRFEFDGGTSFDPAKDSHMHSSWIEFVSPDEIRGEWQAWAGGKPSDHSVKFHLKRRPA